MMDSLRLGALSGSMKWARSKYEVFMALGQLCRGSWFVVGGRKGVVWRGKNNSVWNKQINLNKALRATRQSQDKRRGGREAKCAFHVCERVCTLSTSPRSCISVVLPASINLVHGVYRSSCRNTVFLLAKGSDVVRPREWDR